MTRRDDSQQPQQSPETVPKKDFARRPMTIVEAMVLVAVLGTGFSVSALLRIDRFDTSSPLATGTLFLLNSGVGILAYWFGLSWFHVPVPVRLAGALWAIGTWSGLHLSSIAYVGLLIIPLEVVVSALALRLRTGLRIPQAFLVASVVRIVLMALISVVRPGIVRFAQEF